jgi:hypothetical protein
MLVVEVEGDVDEHEPVEVAETFLDALVEHAPELVVLPEHHDLLPGIIGLDVVGVDAPLRPERRLPAHGPGKRLGLAQLLVARGEEKLRDLLLVQIPARGEIPGRAERAEHEMDVVLLHQIAGQLQCGRRIGIVVAGDEADLASVDAAARIDHVEIGGLRRPDRAEFRERPRIRHDIADADFVVACGLVCVLLRHRAERGERDHENERHPADDAHVRHLDVGPTWKSAQPVKPA